MKPVIPTCGSCALRALLLLGSVASAQVASHQKISAVAGNFGGTLHDSDFFGWSVASLGDLDGDGNEDIAVGSPGPYGQPWASQAVWVLFLEADGTVRSYQRITEGEGGFQGTLDPGGGFGGALASPGDLDGDGVVDLAVGHLDGGPFAEGAVWLLFLERDGTVGSEQKIDTTSLDGALHHGDWFGGALSAPGDLDGDGTPDLLVGAPFDKDGGMNRGAFYVLHLAPDGGVISWSKIGQLQLGAALLDWGRFGRAVTLLDDLDGDGQREFAVGAPGPIFTQPPVGPGSVWILFPQADGSIGRWQEIGLGTGGFTGNLLANEKFGSSLTVVDDLDGDERGELVVGARGEMSGGAVQVGGLWILSLDADGRVTRERHVANGIGGLPSVLGGGDDFGCAAAALGDLNRDGVRDLVVGSFGDSDGASAPYRPVGAVHVLFLNEGLAPLAKDYGCGVDPPGSLTRLSGEPRLGAELHLGVDNPLGTMASGAHAWLLLSTAPHPAYPCGALWPCFGMAGRGAPGEFLLDWRFLGLVDSRRAGPWLGPGQPVDFRLGVPANPALLGFRLYAQGLLLDLSGPRPFLGLSTAMELRIGSPAAGPPSPATGGLREVGPARGLPWGMSSLERSMSWKAPPLPGPLPSSSGRGVRETSWTPGTAASRDARGSGPEVPAPAVLPRRDRGEPTSTRIGGRALRCEPTAPPGSPGPPAGVRPNGPPWTATTRKPLPEPAPTCPNRIPAGTLIPVSFQPWSPPGDRGGGRPREDSPDEQRFLRVHPDREVLP